MLREMGLDQRGSGAKEKDSYFLKRKEEKYEMHLGAAAFLRNEIERYLPRFEFRKGHSHTYITTVYFDTERLEFYQTAKNFYDDNIKVRVKEYYYQNDSGPASTLVRPAAGSLLTFDSCYVEIKQRIRGLVVKRRFGIPKKLLGKLLRGEDIWGELISDQKGIEYEGFIDTYREFRWFVQHYQVIEKSIINYRRSVYQEDEHELRITFDDEIAVFKPLPGLYDAADSLARDQLGTPERIFENVIMEIKCQNGYPDWLMRLLRTHQPQRISKFTSSLRVLTHELPCPETENGAKSAIFDAGEGRTPSSEDTAQVPGIQR